MEANENIQQNHIGHGGGDNCACSVGSKKLQS
jgi:hypothetical protein